MFSIRSSSLNNNLTISLWAFEAAEINGVKPNIVGVKISIFGCSSKYLIISICSLIIADVSGVEPSLLVKFISLLMNINIVTYIYVFIYISWFIIIYKNNINVNTIFSIYYYKIICYWVALIIILLLLLLIVIAIC